MQQDHFQQQSTTVLYRILQQCNTTVKHKQTSFHSQKRSQHSLTSQKQSSL